MLGLLRDASQDETSAPKTGVVIVPAPVRGQPVYAATEEAAPIPTVTENPPIPADVKRLILRALEDTGAELHGIRPAGGDGQTYCGEVSSPAHPQRRRFVFLASTRMVATDDDSGDFAGIAELCGN